MSGYNNPLLTQRVPAFLPDQALSSFLDAGANVQQSDAATKEAFMKAATPDVTAVDNTRYVYNNPARIPLERRNE
jgi:hypothetical protein